MQRNLLPRSSQRFLSIPDLVILLVIGATIYGVVSLGNAWRADFSPVTDIKLSGWALPKYTILSGLRGSVAYVVSLLFTLVVGFAAAKSPRAERVIIPALDILQSIPVLGFLPGLVLGLIAIFPKTNIGLELAAVLTIFTGQVWNMTFSYYSSLKSVPTEFSEAATVIGLNWWQRLIRLELPFSAVGLGWNSVLSMAGGWFFLSVSEAFSLGDREFRLPGVGSYMAVAIDRGNVKAMWLGVLAMVTLIVGMDLVIWRPILNWIRRFRLEEVPGVAPAEPLMGIVFRESRIIRWVKVTYRRRAFRAQLDRMGGNPVPAPAPALAEGSSAGFLSAQARLFEKLSRGLREPRARRLWPRLAETVFFAVGGAMVAWGMWKLVGTLAAIPRGMWFLLFRDTFWTFLRVIAAIFISTLWAVPAGIWIGTSERRTRIAQPIIQVVASFPAPMLYPLALAIFFTLHISFDWGSMLLMLLGVQWYVLFNVLAGALRIPQELRYALAMMESSRLEKWRMLYVPSVFPSLVTGWVTAAGGAWNASIVSEVLKYKGQKLSTGGIGARISAAAERGDMPMLAASLTVMVVVVLLMNRSVWRKIYHLAQTRYRLDL